MSSIHSLLTRITKSISSRTAESGSLYIPADAAYDFAVGGIPFFSAANDQRPDTERPVPQKKEQFDSYKDPGEYSLNQWWLRSQSSWTGGAGIVYQDPDTQGSPLNIRYADSIGIDPFTDVDNMRLLKEVNESATFVSTNSNPVEPVMESFITDDGTQKTWIIEGNSVKTYTFTDSDLVVSNSVTLPVSPDPNDQVVNAGTPTYRLPWSFGFKDQLFCYQYRNTHANDVLYRLTDTSPITVEAIYGQPPPNTNSVVTALAVARGSLLAGTANSLYVLNPQAGIGSAWPVAPAASVPIDQEIISITDGPNAVYVAANSNTEGYIYKTTFDSTTGAINGLTQIAILPQGERVNQIACYLATYMIITTQTGIRVGTFTTSITGANLAYGPQILSVPILPGQFPGVGLDTSGFGKISFYGKKAYVSTQGAANIHGGAFGMIAVNLGVLITDQTAGVQFNSYCKWVYNPSATDPITSFTVTGDDRIVYATRAPTLSHVYVQHATHLISQGYLDTGRCRFNTIEPKLFKFVGLRTPTPLQGDVQMAVLDEGGGITNYITYGPTLVPGPNDVSTPFPVGQQNWISLRLTLKRNISDPTLGGALDSWQIKALPGTLKQRNITKQFLCFNTEKDRNGQIVFSPTGAIDRLNAIRQMCQRGDTVTFQDLSENFSDQVIVDDYQMTIGTTPNVNSEVYGGVLTVVLRTIADSVPAITPNSGVSDD